MAENTLSIINGALYKLGERPIMSVEDETTQGRAAKALHAQASRYILAKRPWTAATEIKKLLSDASWTAENSARFPYRFRIPNKVVKILRVFDKDEDQYYNWQRRGNFIVTDLPSISVEYIEDITSQGRVDSALAQVMVCYLAYLLAPRLTKEEAVAGRLYQEYAQALREAAASDSQQRAPLFYGPNAPVQGDYYGDHPDGWVDR